MNYEEAKRLWLSVNPIRMLIDKRKRMTHRRFARKMGMDASSLGKYIRGVNPLGPKITIRIANALGVRPDKLMSALEVWNAARPEGIELSPHRTYLAQVEESHNARRREREGDQVSEAASTGNGYQPLGPMFGSERRTLLEIPLSEIGGYLRNQHVEADVHDPGLGERETMDE